MSVKNRKFRICIGDNDGYKDTKIGVICSIVQIILSIICLIYSAINQENIILWVIFLCSGILSLSSNISRNNKKEDE